jgi:2,4-dienoyl-CoA reductase-like NADH-dependent reductase (Old Yellow Enzyme family)/thioredoxin reductase
MSSYPHLLSPLRIGNLMMKNRIAVPPMSADDDAYEMRARGGAALVTLGEAMVHGPTAISHPGTMILDDESNMPLLIRSAERIKRHQALASIELVHSGRRSNPLYTRDHMVYGPSAGMGPYGVEVTPMSEDLMAEIADAFAHGAFMAQLAGFDMCMVHAGHGWLLAQFLSPLNNQRTDRFGGSLENRARFPTMVLDRIRAKCGANFPIELRLSGDEFFPGGMKIDETVELARMLAEKVDIIHVSATTFHQHGTAGIRMFPNMFLPPACNAHLAGAIKKAVNIPVAAVGAIHTPELMERIIAEGTADIVCVGRGIIADPDLPRKITEGREYDITRCTRCNVCISGGFIPHVPIATGVVRCSVNPTCGRESEFWLKEPPVNKKNVLVIGGGPAGMQAAITAADRGHEVTLVEKSDSLGGMLKKAVHPPFKADLKEFTDVLVRRVSHRPIHVKLNTIMSPEKAQSLVPDVIIAALGAEPISPSLAGKELPHVMMATEIQKNEAILGQTIVVVGGGLVGCEEGLHLAMLGKNVTILEMRSDLAKDANFLHWKALMLELEKYVKTVTNTTVQAITPQGVIASNPDGIEQFYPADSVVLATGMRPLSQQAEAFRNCAPEFICIGDCCTPQKVQEAIQSGYNAGYYLR